MSGRCVPPRERVVEDPGVAGRVVLVEHRRHGAGHRARGARGCARPASPSARWRRTGRWRRRGAPSCWRSAPSAPAPRPSRRTPRAGRPRSTWSAIGSSSLIAPSPPPRRRRCAPARRDDERGAGQLEHRRPVDLRGAPRPSTGASCQLPPNRTGALARRSARSAAGRRRRLRAGQRRGHAHRHQLQLASGSSSSRSGCACARSNAARRSAGSGSSSPSTAQLERLARVAQVVGGAQLGVGRAQLLAAARAQAPNDLRDGLARERRSPVSSTLSTTSRRRSETASPSADSTPETTGTTTRRMPSSSAIAAACSGPAPPNATSARSRGSIPRSHGHHPHRLRHLGVGHAHDPLGSVLRRQAELLRQRADRPLGGVAVEPHVAGQRRVRVAAGRAAGPRRSPWASSPPRP